MTDKTLSRKLFGMFVSIAVDPGSEERARELTDLLAQYGFEKVQRGLWESAIVTPATLDRLKRDLDRATDAYDRIRIFQFPVEGTLVLTSLREKKWRRMVARVPNIGNTGGQSVAAPHGVKTPHPRMVHAKSAMQPDGGKKN